MSFVLTVAPSARYSAAPITAADLISQEPLGKIEFRVQHTDCGPMERAGQHLSPSVGHGHDLRWQSIRCGELQLAEGPWHHEGGQLHLRGEQDPQLPHREDGLLQFPGTM